MPQCSGKVAYAKRRDAKKFGNRAYRCQHCRKFHATSQRRGNPNKRLKRAA